MQELPFKNAFVLHTRDFKENQIIADLLVEGEGRLAVVGYKGSKKNSAKTALYAPFRAIKVQIKPGKGLHKLVAIESNSSPLTLTGNRLFCGFYLNELLCRLCIADAPYETLHQTYQATLSQLESLADISDKNLQAAAVELVLRRFEDKLLTAIGYELILSSTLDTGEAIVANEYYEFFEGGLVKALSVKNAYMGLDLIGVSHLLRSEGNTEVETINYLKQAKHILRLALHRHLGDKPLKSRELFRK